MFTSVLTGTFTAAGVGICLLAAVVSGFIMASAYRFSAHPSRSFLITLAILPSVVMLVIMMVNGSLGAGIAVAGSFSLVRFRSLPGRASDILAVFIVMALGLCTGMGYAVLAVILAVILGFMIVFFSKMPVLKENENYRNLRVTIPEDLDYMTVFDSVFRKYTNSAQVNSVRTMNLGTMYQISYDIELKDPSKEKDMIDELRVRNSNLAIISGRMAVESTEL